LADRCPGWETGQCNVKAPKAAEITTSSKEAIGSGKTQTDLAKPTKLATWRSYMAHMSLVLALGMIGLVTFSLPRALRGLKAS